jgi:hypothetical protein
MSERRLAMIVCAALGLSPTALFAAGCIDVIRSGETTIAGAGPDAAVIADGSTSLDSGADGSVDGAVGDGASLLPEDVCPTQVFAANFDSSQDPASNWSSALNSAQLADGGKGSGGLITLVEGGTTPPRAVEFVSFADSRKNDSAVALLRSVPWDGTCIGMAFDLLVTPRVGGSAVTVANIAPFAGDVGLGLLLDAAENTEASLTFYATTQQDGGATPQVVGTLRVPYAQWHRITMTFRQEQQSKDAYTIRAEARPVGGVPMQFTRTVTTKAAPTTATIALGLFLAAPSESRIQADTVSLSSGP